MARRRGAKPTISHNTPVGRILPAQLISPTNLGIRVKSNNKEVGGTYGGKLMYWNTYKSNLTKAQREMRNIRLEAQRNGHNIPQSHYETVVLVLSTI